jgi:hypothetical protein
LLDTNLLAGSSSSSRQTGKQAVTEGRKEGSFACLLALLVRQLLSTGKLVTPVAATIKMACLPNLGCGKKRWVQ